MSIMKNKVYILGGAQTDFERNWTKEGKTFIAMLKEAVEDGFKDAEFTFDEMVSLNKKTEWQLLLETLLQSNISARDILVHS